MHPIHQIALLFAAILTTSSSPALGDEYDLNLESPTREVQENPLAKGGYWLEIGNSPEDWEKMILVFGYADPGEEAACADLLEYSKRQNPNGDNRCNPVN